MFNPTWLYAAAVYAGFVAVLRWNGVELRKRVAVFFYAVVFVFMYLPLTQDYVDLPVDFLKTMPPWVYQGPDRYAANPMMNDVPLQIVPWAHLVRESWKSLEIPLWNASAACGYPLLANGQSAALSPLRLLGLPLSLGHAMTFEAAMKILIAMTFLFLWCRRRGYAELASVIGAVAFGFSTFAIVWLHFPLMTTAALVPAVFYLVDLIAERRTFGRLVMLAVVFAVMLFGGHPETFAHVLFFAALYALWIAFVERAAGAPIRFLASLAGAVGTGVLLAAPMIVPLAEAVTRSQRYADLLRHGASEVPFTGWEAAILFLQPHFFGASPADVWGPMHAESITGFAGVLGVAAWVALVVHVIATRRWRSREAFFVVATVIVLGIVLAWPGISTVFQLLFRFTANARLRLMLALLSAVMTAAMIDLVPRDRRSVLIGIAAASALLVIVLATTRFAFAYRHDVAVLEMLPSIAVLGVATVAALIASTDSFAVLFLLVAVIAELWNVGSSWNPIVPERWMYPKTPLLRALDDLADRIPASQPFRITANASMLFPNNSAVFGYEDVRAHDPMVGAQYTHMLSVVSAYDPQEYFAAWREWEKHVLDFLNVRFVLTTPGGILPPRYRLLYDGRDGRIFENPGALPRFYAVRNVILDFDDASFERSLASLDDWGQTAMIERLDDATPKMRDDFFQPRPPDSPVAAATITKASTSHYAIHVTAPRWSLVVSSVSWWPGWKIECDGTRIAPIRVNGAFLGFAVPPGSHEVRVWYSPWTFWAGLWISIATCVVLAGCGRYKRWT